jgi:hypothetical protein
MSYRVKGAILIVGTPVIVVALVSAWLIAASRLFVLMGGLGRYFPEPYTTWWLYVRQPTVEKWTKLYLAASGVVAGIPVLLLIVCGAGVALRWYRHNRPALYGETGWAKPPDMRRGGISTDRAPF